MFKDLWMCGCNTLKWINRGYVFNLWIITPILNHHCQWRPWKGYTDSGRKQRNQLIVKAFSGFADLEGNDEFIWRGGSIRHTNDFHSNSHDWGFRKNMEPPLRRNCWISFRSLNSVSKDYLSTDACETWIKNGFLQGRAPHLFDAWQVAA